jgi:hypothetical protein
MAEVKVQVLLADKGTANPPQATLNLLNAGWLTTQLVPTPQGLAAPAMAVAVFFEVDVLRCGQPVPMVIELVDDDGMAVPMATPDGTRPVRIEQTITVAAPPSAPHGTPGRGNTLVEIVPGLVLRPGGYRWRVQLDGREEEDWSAYFVVIGPPGPAGSP